MKTDALEVYIRAEKQIRLSAEQRAEMLAVIGSPAAAEQYSEQAYRQKQREILWRRIEKWGGIAAVLTLVFCIGFLIRAGIRQNTVQITAPAVSEADLSGYLAHFAGKETVHIGRETPAHAYQQARRSQQEDLRQMQQDAELNAPRDSTYSARFLPVLWYFTERCIVEQNALQTLKECEPLPVPAQLLGREYCEEDGVLYITVVNTADTPLDWFAECGITSDQTDFHAEITMPQYAMSWLKDYYSGSINAEASGRNVLHIPAHGCMEIAVSVPAEQRDLTEQLLTLNFYPVAGEKLSYHISLDSDEQVMPRAEEHRILRMAVEAEPAPWEKFGLS